MGGQNLNVRAEHARIDVAVPALDAAECLLRPPTCDPPRARIAGEEVGYVRRRSASPRTIQPDEFLLAQVLDAHRLHLRTLLTEPMWHSLVFSTTSLRQADGPFLSSALPDSAITGSSYLGFVRPWPPVGMVGPNMTTITGSPPFDAER